MRQLRSRLRVSTNQAGVAATKRNIQNELVRDRAMERVDVYSH
jgi:hypothetical protein